MTLANCIINGVNEGIIPNQKQFDMLDNFEQSKNRYMELGMSEEAAAKQAGLDTFDKVNFDRARKAKLAIIQAKKQAQFNYLVETSGLNPG